MSNAVEAAARCEQVRDVSERILRRPVESVEPIPGVPNNTVYRLTVRACPPERAGGANGRQSAAGRRRAADAGRRYIFKEYVQRDWPEDGKLPLINRLLREAGIPCARLHAFDRKDARFPGGYALEDCLPGVSANTVPMDRPAACALFTELARIASRFHTIRMGSYGYIGGSGDDGWSSFTGFIEDSHADRTALLLREGVFSEAELDGWKHAVKAALAPFDRLPPVLTHGDLSLKNIMLDGGRAVLIDWDDAMALPEPADVYRLTLWMKLYYRAEEAKAYTDAFLSAYTGLSDGDYRRYEPAFHVWYGLDYLNFFAASGPGSPQYRTMLDIIETSLRALA